MSWLNRLGFLATGGALRTDDAALLTRVAAGDADALALLYRRESGAVYRYALALCGNEAMAMDALHEAFARLLQGSRTFDPAQGSLAAYLAGIARHQLLSQWRRGRREVPLDEQPGLNDADEESEIALPGSDQPLLQRQQQQHLWTAIRRLAASQREALVLVDLQERSYEEAAAVAGVSTDVLRTRLHRARQRLSELLSAGDPS